MMPRVTAKRDIHELYSPKSRSGAFPEADFRFLVHVGANISRAVAVIHEHGHVIGDINHGNILVGVDGTAMFIDCDSFQVCSAQYVFTCDVGVPLFTAPELHGRSFRGLKRERNHDLFGLAVILFHLLFMGRHPFAGRYLGHGDMTIERAISEYRFAYGPDRSYHQMERPPGTPTIEIMGRAVAESFIAAFGRNGQGKSRPDARAWIKALETLEISLRECSSANWHHFPRDLRDCPWCSIEQETGVRLFGVQIRQVGEVGVVDVGTLWKAIEAVPDPGTPPPLPSEKPWFPPAGIELPSGNILGKMFRRMFSPEIIAEADKVVFSAKAEWQSVLALWRSQALRDPFSSKFNELSSARAQLIDLPMQRQRRFAIMEGQREVNQMERYLDRFRIDRGSIPGIGDARSSMLASFGIETAADISRVNIQRIPGFGEVLTTSLLKWRESHERRFSFNPSEPVDPREIAKMDQELRMRRDELVAKLKQGGFELRQISQQITAARQRLMPVIEKAWNALKIAEARRSAL